MGPVKPRRLPADTPGMDPRSWLSLAREGLPLAALGLALLHSLSARRAEQLFERVQDLNRERLSVLERDLDPGSGRSRMEALSLQLDAAAQASVSARRLARWMLLVLATIAVAAVAGSIARLRVEPLPHVLQIAWLGGAMLGAIWKERDLGRAAAVAEESTAHARRYEFLYVTEMRKKM